MEDYRSPKVSRVGAVGGQEKRLGDQKVGFTPWLIRHMGRDLGQFNPSETERHSATKLECPRFRAPYAISILKTPVLGGSRPALAKYSVNQITIPNYNIGYQIRASKLKPISTIRMIVKESSRIEGRI
eukprot:1160963-Pelagomonas_calceolata.AAC.2